MRHGVCIAIIAVATPAAAAAQEVDVSLGGSYSSGKYGGEDSTELGSAYLNLGTTFSRWRIDTTMPYLSLRSGGAPVDVGGLPLPGGVRASGFGDLTVRASRATRALAHFDIMVGAQVKVPTGEAGLSTGKLDASFDLELARPFGAVAPFVGVAYHSYGDSELIELQDGWSVSAGSSATLGNIALIGSYDWAESSVGGSAAHELSAIVVGPIARGWGWSFFGSKGLSSGAADFLFGAGITRSFGGSGTPSVRRPRRS
jgi:hypothetical protein